MCTQPVHWTAQAIYLNLNWFACLSLSLCPLRSVPFRVAGVGLALTQPYLAETYFLPIKSQCGVATYTTVCCDGAIHSIKMKLQQNKFTFCERKPKAVATYLLYLVKVFSEDIRQQSKLCFRK